MYVVFANTCYNTFKCVFPISHVGACSTGFLKWQKVHSFLPLVKKDATPRVCTYLWPVVSSVDMITRPKSYKNTHVQNCLALGSIRYLKLYRGKYLRLFSRR